MWENHRYLNIYIWSIYIYINVYIRMHVHIHMYTQVIYRYTYMYIYTYMYMHKWESLFVLGPGGGARSICFYTTTHCNTLQHTATHCNTLQHTATHRNILQHTATYCCGVQGGCTCERKRTGACMWAVMLTRVFVYINICFVVYPHTQQTYTLSYI